MYTLEDLFDRRSQVGTRLEQILMFYFYFFTINIITYTKNSR